VSDCVVVCSLSSFLVAAKEHTDCNRFGDDDANVVNDCLCGERPLVCFDALVNIVYEEVTLVLFANNESRNVTLAILILPTSNLSFS